MRRSGVFVLLLGLVLFAVGQYQAHAAVHPNKYCDRFPIGPCMCEVIGGGFNCEKSFTDNFLYICFDRPMRNCDMTLALPCGEKLKCPVGVNCSEVTFHLCTIVTGIPCNKNYNKCVWP